VKKFPHEWFPEEPAVEDRGEGDSGLRYEDVSQDGRLMLLALPHTIGDVIWRKIIAQDPQKWPSELHKAGIVGVLTRFVIEGGEGPIPIGRPLHARGCFQFSHTVDTDGKLDRILLNMWTDATGPRGRTHGPQPEGAGEPVFVGRVFAEHVMTRIFAPPSERKVLSLPGIDCSTRWQWRGLEEVLELPPRAQELDQLSMESELVFGLAHTDSNQHVNSLVYPRLFQDAALRRFAAHGLDTRVLAQRLEIAYRKPCFAGERAKILLRAFVVDGKPGAVGAFVSPGAPLERPHCVISMRFE
jgi:hypothetical protein